MQTRSRNDLTERLVEEDGDPCPTQVHHKDMGKYWDVRVGVDTKGCRQLFVPLA